MKFVAIIPQLSTYAHTQTHTLTTKIMCAYIGKKKKKKLQRNPNDLCLLQLKELLKVLPSSSRHDVCSKVLLGFVTLALVDGTVTYWEKPYTTVHTVIIDQSSNVYLHA